MNFVKKNKFTVMIIIIFLVFVVVTFQITKLFFPDSRSPQYGNRLENIDKVKIDNSKLDNLKATLEENEYIKEVSAKLSGKTINVNVIVSDETTIENSKKISELVLPFFDEEQQNFYDIQILIGKKDKKLNNFPIIGYKHFSSKEFVWTKDRGVTEDEK